MAKRTGPTNPVLRSLIEELKKKAQEHKAAIWSRIAADLQRPSRNRRAVNLSRIDRFTKENDVVIVPGKVLGTGTLGHKVTISAFTFSEGAKEKIISNGSKIIPLAELINEDPKGKGIMIIG